MVTGLEGKDISLWVETTPKTNYPVLSTGGTVYDLAIIGGGITGLMAGYYALHAGLKTVVIEKGRIVEWTTGGTTAKLTSQHYLIYDYLIKRHGEKTAQAFAGANQRGIDEVERISKELGIDCEFARRDAYVFSQHGGKLDEMKAEVEAARKLGLPASFETEIDLPYDIAGAVKFANQAQFHPRKFLLGVADKLAHHGAALYEQTEATDIEPGEPNVVKTKHGDIKAKYVLQASGEPFWRKDIFDGRMWIKMSYALAVKLKNGAEYPKNMYITTDQPLRTIRSATFEGEPVMIFGGESHEYEESTYDEGKTYRALIDDVHKRYDVEKVLFRWLAGDYMPYDRIPYIGAMPEHPSVYVITGYRAWGLAWAMAAAQVVIRDIVGTPDAWAKPFDLERLKQPVLESDKTTKL